jgi:TPR repeat protein
MYNNSKILYNIVMDTKKAHDVLNALRRNKVMNDEDLENLAFLLLTPTEELKHWYAAVDSQDLDYAKSLLEIAQDYFSDDAREIDTTQARQFLKRFML